MSSASCYTNKVRVTYEAKNTKVQYPQNVGRTPGSLYPALNCNPNFSVYNYIIVNCNRECVKPYVSPPPSGPTIYSGGNAPTESTTILTGGNEGTESTNVLSGGNA